ncbi:Hsp70 chaperone [Entomophthora muscae]|uniref:Hsp70 chaperone n=1 Tax=Entomophthora muscae TaxID=34485 RepID=A0ACC2RGI7_9FUNG|nr:Hsp70 chaperone [Entomophthora muscae]
MADQAEYPIGIDLGTTYSCVGAYMGEQVEIITNDKGNRTTPSCVAFNDETAMVGEAAQDQASWNVKNTVFDIKRVLGRSYEDSQLQEDIKLWPFKVRDRDGMPVIEVLFKGKVAQFSPEEISAIILGKLKKTAEMKLGVVKDAVITVPAYFNNAQRQATIDAGESAGLNVLQVLAEPTAAALAYGLEASSPGIKNVLIYDLGGGTFDVSLLTIEGRVFKVLATSGNTQLGGEDFNTLLVKHFIEEFNKVHRCDISTNPGAVRRLRVACERAKRKLSFITQISVEIDGFYDDIDFQSVLTREKFEQVCEHLFASTLDCVSKLLGDASLEKTQIDKVVLSGGSSRIPKIQQLLSEYFDSDMLDTSIDLDEAVARGAAIQAIMLKGGSINGIKGMCLVDVSSLSLGVESNWYTMVKIIKRSSTLPAAADHIFTTTSDYQKAVRFRVFEGESSVTEENFLLGEFLLEDIEIEKKGVPKFIVSFQIDLSGILHVSAKDKTTGVHKDITIHYRNRSAQKTTVTPDTS